MLFDGTRWDVIYRDYYGNEIVLASFMWFDDAMGYITEKKLMNARLKACRS